MYHSPYDYNSIDYYRTPTQSSYIRMYNASPKSPSLDIYANGKLLVKNLSYEHFSQYMPLQSGNYKLAAFPSDNAEKPVLYTDLYITDNSIFNITIVGIYPNIDFYPIPEPTAPLSFGRPCIRFINLSPDSPAVNVNLADGTRIFSNVAYKYITDYACMPTGTYMFQISSTDNSTILLKLPAAQLLSNTYYTIYLSGLSSGNPPLQALIVTEPR